MLSTKLIFPLTFNFVWKNNWQRKMLNFWVVVLVISIKTAKHFTLFKAIIKLNKRDKIELIRLVLHYY